MACQISLPKGRRRCTAVCSDSNSVSPCRRFTWNNHCRGRSTGQIVNGGTSSVTSGCCQRHRLDHSRAQGIPLDVSQDRQQVLVGFNRKGLVDPPFFSPKQDAYAANLADERNIKTFLAVLPEYHNRVCNEMRCLGEPRWTSNATEHCTQKNPDKTRRWWCASLVFHRCCISVLRVLWFPK